MSLCYHKLNLSTKPYGQPGKHFGFDHFGETKNILYVDLVDINENHPNFKEAGYYYILDDRVVASEGLVDIYEHILNKDQMNKILSNQKDAMQLFQKANPKQQKILVNFLIEKIANNESVDFNLVNAIDSFQNPNHDPEFLTINMCAQRMREANVPLPENANK
jgi:hypothetical protein